MRPSGRLTVASSLAPAGVVPRATTSGVHSERQSFVVQMNLPCVSAPTRDGRRLPLAWFGLDEGTWGGAVPVALDAVWRIRLLDREGRVVLEVSVPPQGE